MLKFFKKNKKEPEGLKEVLAHLKKLEKNHENVSREFEDFKEKSKKNLQKVGLVRFNPFKEIGSNQSFSIALLDDNNNGFLVTSLYGRETNRVYAKPIEGGQSPYSLSEEEGEALKKAMNVK